jgi:acyl carrier protein
MIVRDESCKDCHAKKVAQAQHQKDNISKALAIEKARAETAREIFTNLENSLKFITLVDGNEDWFISEIDLEALKSQYPE